jgi:8-oxo-dGTP pyrophosphatase MutT (NUDIX family)
MNWKILSSQYLEKHKYFTARKDKCERQDGKIIDPYYVVELPRSATALAITEDNKVLLVRQYRHPIQQTIIETPGGFIDEGEDHAAGMKRELLEETGYEFNDIEYLATVAANPGVLSGLTDLFLAKGGKKVKEQELDHNEEIEIIEVSMEELIDLIRNNRIVQSLHTNCIMYGLIKSGKLNFVV